MVVILARINPGETPTSYIAQGLMDFMVSSHPLAGALRDHTIIKIVPMINPDGSYLGNYRTSLMGYDLNRHWNQVSPWSHPTLHTIKNVLIDLDASKTIDLDMVIDLHAHASLMGCFIYGNAYDDVYRFERHILFPKLLAHNAEDYNPSHTMYNRDPNKAGTARRHLCEILRNTVNVYTMEVSYFGYTQALSNAIITYNEDGYLRLGRNLARTFFEYYKATGIIPQTVLSATAATAPGDDNNDRGGGHKNSMRGGKSRPRARSRTKGKSRDKSHTRSPSNPKDGIAGAIPANTNVNDNDNEDDEGENEMDKTVVKLPQLTKEIARHSDSSDIDSSDEEQVKVRATKNGTIFQQQYIRRRSSTANPLLQTTRSRTDTNGDNVTNVSNNHNGKGHTGKSHQPTGRPVQLLNLSETSPQRGPLSFTSQPNEVEVKKAAYQTFDFSILKEHRHHGHVSRELPGHNGASAVSTTTTTRHKVRRFTHKRPDETENTRKIGGGGIIGRRKGRVRESRRREVQSETETESPCLTIIDFNMLIRKALEGRGSYGGGKGRDGGWRGWSSGHRLRDRREISGHATDGGGGGPSIMLSGRRRNNVRRRRAILLRGTVTDCSPWEEDDEDAAAAVGTLSSDSSDDDVLSPHAASSLKGNLTRRDFNLNKKGNRRRVGRRKRSPATPTLSPSPIFLPQ
ncbi:Cytosolic carboxypeptidase 6 [Folsomia candida]|uniref:Cytosolic carboxypeptidase 6 n=2 Tax=Folsomia candida TaxID=158441 RepID=A0A226E6K3_FOLCA|nr:Cytosolic carboxypeptidase 6 [Folsomia candida]